MARNSTPSPHEDFRPTLEIDGHMVEVKRKQTTLRGIRAALMQLAYALAQRPECDAYLVLPESKITAERLRREWHFAARVFRPAVIDRLCLWVEEGEEFVGIPRDPGGETRRILAETVGVGRRSGERLQRPDASFVVLKILLHRWLTDGAPVTTRWLMETAGFSYPTVASVLSGLGSLVERQSDRSVGLRWFPRDEYLRLLAIADSARSTVRFADRSGQPRSPETHLRRLEKLSPRDLAIGGVLGAKHYFPELDLVGTPRLDLSLHCPSGHMDIGFVADLDPALKRIDDPREPASLVVHAVRHAESLFTPREKGLAWADPLECLLDLSEARLEMQAAQFLEALQRRRPQ